MGTRFKGHYLLPDRDAPADGTRLIEIMAGNVGVDYDYFKQPQPPYVFKDNATSLESYQWLWSYLLPEIPLYSVIFGVGIGGLLAAKLQEDYPDKWLFVVAINSPRSEEPIHLGGLNSNRVAIYSSSYPPIIDRCDWGHYAGQSYDVPWLQHGIKNTKFGLAHLLTSYMQAEDLTGAIASFTDDALVKK